MGAEWLSISVKVITLSVLAIGAQPPDPDVEQALASGRARAAGGDVVAQFSIGSFLYYGTRETAQAIEWFRKAAAQGYAPAEFQMGQLYDFGFGVAQSDAQALAWYRKAAEHGSVAGQRSVADFYRKGRAVPSDLAEAARWYRRAAEGDDIRAQAELGQLYMSGAGVARDYRSAYVWFAIAAGQAPLLDNRAQLIELRNVAAGRLTPSELAAAERRVALWKPAVK